MSRIIVTAIVTAGVMLATRDVACAHLFHKVWEPPETQLTRDTRVLQLLLDDPTERFELARLVYEGRERVRLKPGGFRRWLVRPGEPGMVFKADYQLHRWSGSLQSEAERIDREYGTRLAMRIESALDGRDREGVRTALREMYAVLLEELLDALGERLDQTETAPRLYGLVLRYWSVNLEAYFNIRHPVAGAVARTALDAMSRALGDPETGAPAAPEVFERQRRRFVRILHETVPFS
ncbi:MAG: hypothetical protein C5B48_03770 [Candidatus Rokuibacteriota bacterium]|nr:MAG: hypothetical protein C5B48_03770 [Candidatus Rokubacteria bacterium]